MTKRQKQNNEILSIVKNIDKNTKPKYQHREMTLYEWSFDWLDTYKRPYNKATTVHKTECMLKAIPNWIMNCPMEELREIDIQRFLISFREKTRQKQHFYTLLKDMLEKAKHSHYISENPMSAMKMPYHQKNHHRAMTKAETELFIESCLKEKHGDMFIIMLFTGMRKGEVGALYYSDLDFDEKIIHITKGLNDFNKLDTPKTRESVRDVPMLDILVPYIEKYKGKKEKKRIFNITDSIVQRHFVSICNRCGFPKGYITTHSLRHTFTTRGLEYGANPKMIQALLGHTTIQMTMNTYAHINDDFAVSEINKLNNKYGRCERE